MENEYLDKVLAGDTDAFRYFVRRYQQMSFTIAFRIIQSREEAEEAVQDAFVKAFKGLRRFRRDSKFSSWLYQIVVREALNRTRKKKYNRVAVDVADLNDNFAAEAAAAIEQLEQQEQKALIQTVLNRLKPKERLVLQLFYLDEHSLKEIVDTTGFSLANVKVLLYRARKNFEKALSPEQLKEIRL